MTSLDPSLLTSLVEALATKIVFEGGESDAYRDALHIEIVCNAVMALSDEHDFSPVVWDLFHNSEDYMPACMVG